MSRLSELEIFVKVVELESFSLAARELELSKSQISKQISRLEDRLGARLVNRTTRRMGLTDVGMVFYQRCVQILTDLEEAELSISQLQSEPRGLLRVSVPMSFGVMYLSPALSDFMASYPELEVELNFNDRQIDLVEEGYDIAIRIGAMADSNLICRKLTPIKLYLCGSPGYLEKRGWPQHPLELRDHNCLRYRYFSTGSIWNFYSGQGKESIRVKGGLQTNNGEALREAALRNIGICILPDFLVAEDLRANRLIQVLDDWTVGEAFSIWALYPHNRHLSVKVRLLVDFLLSRFSPIPPWASCEAETNFSFNLTTS